MTYPNITYLVFEIYPDGKEEYVDTLSLTIESSNKLLSRYGLGPYGYITEQAIILAIFDDIYKFTKGTNGFCLTWNGSSKEVGTISWKVDTWRIRKIEKEVKEDVSK
jgi:hypothetical protein